MQNCHINGRGGGFVSSPGLFVSTSQYKVRSKMDICLYEVFVAAQRGTGGKQVPVAVNFGNSFAMRFATYAIL